LDVHCAPFVKVITPGWIAADPAGAHAVAALGASAATASDAINAVGNLVLIRKTSAVVVGTARGPGTFHPPGA
jgi:hypothetical protein